jgi:pimeloyl-ACP methyl ester carboxylesterase
MTSHPTTYHTTGESMARERTVQSIGLQTRALEVGDETHDEAVVFLHGVPGSAHHWDQFLPQVEPFARGVAIDLPGFGQADKPKDWEYSPNAYANFIAGALHDLGIRRCHLVMNDLGGVGLFWAAAHPDSFASAVVIDTGVASTYRRWHAAGQLYRAPIFGRVAVAAGRLGYRQVMRAYLPQPRRLPKHVASDMRREYGLGGRRALLRFYRAANPPAWDRIASALAPLDRPALVIWGAHDRFLRVDQAREQLRSFPSADVVVLPDSGHYAHLDDPETVTGLMVPFLRAQLRDPEPRAQPAHR